MNGVERIARERTRQIGEEGYARMRDMQYAFGELARAAAAYAIPDELRTYPNRFKAYIHWKPSPDNRIRELEKAGALIAAEIDRLVALEEGK